MFREDLDWDKFANYIRETYPQGANCDIFACSDGSEAYSLALKLNNPRYKMHASDFDSENIAVVQKGLISLNQEDLPAIERHTNKKWTNFFEQVTSDFKVKDNLKDVVEFSICDIGKDLNHYNFANNVVCMVRNVWYHFNTDEKVRILGEFYKKLPKGASFVIGEQEELNAPKSFSILVSRFLTPVSEFQNRYGCIYLKNKF